MNFTFIILLIIIKGQAFNKTAIEIEFGATSTGVVGSKRFGQCLHLSLPASYIKLCIY